jgi:hypothetical protein
MAARINAKTVKNTLSDLLASDAEIVKSAGALFAFYATASSGDPLTFAAGIGLIATAAASAIKGASELIKRLSGATTTVADSIAPYERFRVLFYTVCIKAYVDSIPDTIAKLKSPEPQAKPTKPKSRSNPTELTTALQDKLLKSMRAK